MAMDGVETAQATPAPLASWLTLLALVAILLFAFVNRQVLTLVAAPIQADLKIDDQQLGLIQGVAFSIFTVLALYPLGWLADRYDRRLILAVCIATWATGSALCGFASNFSHLFFAVMLVAAGEAGLAPLILSAIPDLFEGQQRVTANLVFYASTFLGVSLGFALGGAAVAALDGMHAGLPPYLASMESWRLAMLAVAIPAPLFMLLTAFMRLERKGVRGVAEAVQPLKPYLREHGTTLMLVLGSIALFGMASAGFYVWVPVAMAREFGVSPAANGGYMATILMVAGLSGLAAGGGLMRFALPRLGRRAVLRIGFFAPLAAAPFALLLPFITAAWQAYAIMGVQLFIGTAYGSILPNVLQDVAPATVRTRIFSIYTIMTTLTTGFVIWLTGAISAMSDDTRFLLVAMTAISFPAWLLAAMVTRLAEPRFVATVARLEADQAGI